MLLKDGRVIGVRGHGLKYFSHAVPGEDVYSIVCQAHGEEILVALFKSAEVAGIFHGEIRPDRMRLIGRLSNGASTGWNSVFTEMFHRRESGCAIGSTA